MKLKFWKHGTKSRDLPAQVRARLASQFRLPAHDMDKMCYIGKEGRRNGRPVRYIRVFDPQAIADGTEAIHDYDDLDASHRRAILFEGHMEKNGWMKLVDRRPPMRTISSKVRPAA